MWQMTDVIFFKYVQKGSYPKTCLARFFLNNIKHKKRFSKNHNNQKMNAHAPCCCWQLVIQVQPEFLLHAAARTPGKPEAPFQHTLSLGNMP